MTLIPPWIDQILQGLDHRPQLPDPPVYVPEPQPDLRRRCGCDTDVTVFGHRGCPETSPALRMWIDMGP